MLSGDARVSKADGSQALDLQRDALRASGVAAGHVYHDFASGVRDDRPGLDNCLRALRRATCSSSGNSTGFHVGFRPSRKQHGLRIV